MPCDPNLRISFEMLSASYGVALYHDDIPYMHDLVDAAQLRSLLQISIINKTRLTAYPISQQWGMLYTEVNVLIGELEEIRKALRLDICTRSILDSYKHIP